MGGKEQETKVTGTGGQIIDITERGQINTYCICINRVMVNPNSNRDASFLPRWLALIETNVLKTLQPLMQIWLPMAPKN